MFKFRNLVCQIEMRQQMIPDLNRFQLINESPGHATGDRRPGIYPAHHPFGR